MTRLEADTKAVDDAVAATWNDFTAQVRSDIDGIKAQLNARQAEHDAARAQRRATQAEDDAVAAVALAFDAIDYAEAAVLQATVARAEADAYP